MSNLPTLVKLEKLVQSIKHGRAELGLTVRGGEIVSITATGKQKHLYNSSNKDTRNNRTALEDILKRIHSQLENKVSSEVIFRVKNVGDKIKYVEIESDQNFTVNKTASSVA